ncbi:Ig-like domain-containing protein [Paenibacillus tyrfis]|uniref:Ig-like domain-containing protein n=1 Tax=Paenibacillus tyrfis TaxID=1501230 RepID=UPI000B597EEF|nr:Ig-like domain-containing protein [Paenibacillus tyrfis]
MKRKKRSMALLLNLFIMFSLVSPLGQALAADSLQAAFGQVLDSRQMELGPGAKYTWQDMKLPQGLEKIHSVEFDPKNTALDLQPGKTNGKVYGMQGVTKMADDADAPGNRVITAINGDFYDMATGVPLGLFMGDGEILTSPPEKWSWLAFGLKNDGTTIYGLSPELTRTLTIGGKTIPISHINRMRENSEELMLYIASFHTSTMTNDLGDEVVLDVLEGEVKSGKSLKLRVAEIHKDKGNTPLKAGQVILSASGSHRAELAGLKIGDEVTASFELEDDWKDVKMAMGGVFMLVKDGVAQTHEDKALYPRVGIGTKADGSIMMVEIDGRAPGFSEGMSYDDLGKIMKDMGAVNALCLDGGGSATFVAKLPGETKRQILNRPSDGSERKTANGLLLVNKAPEGAASKLVVQPNLERVLVGSSVTFKTAAVDANGHPASYSGAPEWSLSAPLGTIDATGKFTAGNQAGMVDVTATAGGLTGKGQVEVVNELTELKFSDAVKTFTSGEKVTLSISALRNGQLIRAQNNKLEWRVEGPIGSINADGTFTATNVTEQSGKIFVKYNNIEASMDVKVGLPPVVLEDFENGTGKYLTESGARYKTVKISEETNEDFVRLGNKSAKLEYDFTETIGTSGAYITAKDLESNIQIPGYPEKIGLWVYGDGKKHWLRGQIRDGNGSAVGIDYADQTVGVDFTGWRYLEAVVPKGRPLPLRMDQPVRYMETKNDNKTAGVLYIDQIRAVYGPTNDDMDPPILKDFKPAEGSTVTTNTPKIEAIGEDYGYDPVKHPGTTLIDPDKIRFYVDGVLIQHTLYPPKGQIHYTPNVPLADGLHSARIKIRDLSGNVTEKEWTFAVDTGSSKIVYDAPTTVYAGNTYTVDIKALKAADIKGGTMEFGFDPANVDGLKVLKGGKLAESQLVSTVEEATGAVKLNFNDVSGAGLTDQDLLGQIQYRIKPDAKDTVKIAFKSGAITFKDKGDTSFGFFGLPVEAAIKHHLQLSWDEHGVVQGMPTTFKVVGENAAPVEGAKVTVIGGAEVGVTDAQGTLVTGALTSEVKEYQLQAVKGDSYSPILKFKVSKLAGSPVPNNVSVTMGVDTTTSKAFTWHTDPTTSDTVVEVVKKSEFTDFNAPNVKRFTGTSYLFNTTDTGTVRVHKAIASGLEPGTQYMFRVGDGRGNYSQNGSLQTAAATGERTKFIFLADSQATNEAGFKLWGDILKKAMTDHPDTEFVVQGGDLVEDGFKENEWNMWFNAAQGILMQTTVVPVVGNHEVTGTRKTEDYLAHFNHPQNGIDSLKGSNFSFDYKNAHFIVLNSEYDFDQQKEWMRKDLAATDKKWKIVAFHRGPFGSMYDSEHIRNTWTPIFDEFQVDLVMNGHDHVYVRTYPMKDKKPVADGEGTTYIVGGSSGPKFYQVWAREWQRVTDGEQVQMYIAAEIDGDEMKFVVKTINDRVVDQFRLLKIPPQSVVIDNPKVNLAVNASVQLNATVLPANASNKSVTWSVYSSSADRVAKVTEDGLVIAQSLGSAVVRATSVWSNVYADSLITVDRLPQIHVEEVRLNQTSGKLKVGQELQLNATVLPENVPNKSVTWSVYGDASKGIAAVNGSGLVKAAAPGTATIRVTSAVDTTKYADFQLTVEEADKPTNPPVSEVWLNREVATLKVEETLQLSARVLPENVLNKNVIWSVEGPAGIANVTEGLVTALNPGEVFIRATSQMDPTKYAQLELIVKEADRPEPVVDVEKIKLDKVKAELKAGEKLQLTATVLPENASNKSVTWAVYDVGWSGVATVTDQGLVTALKPGPATIRAISQQKPEIFASFELTVKEADRPEPVVDVEKIKLDKVKAELKAGEKLQLTATVFPENASNKSVTWAVYDVGWSGVATVTDQGLVAALKPGSATIRVISQQKPEIFASFELTVKEVDNSDSSDSGSSGDSSTPVTSGSTGNTNTQPQATKPGTATVTQGSISVEAKVEAGTAKVEIRAEDLERAQKEAKSDSDGAKVVRVEVKGAQNANHVEISLPKKSVTKPAPDNKFEIVTPIGCMIVPSDFLKDKNVADSDFVSLIISKEDPSSISEEARKEVGSRPIVNLEVREKGAFRAWNNPDTIVRIAIPYKPTAKELENPGRIVIRYLDAAGRILPVPSGFYDPTAGTVRFEVKHFSKYAVAFVDKTFADIAAYAWAKPSIEALAAREIIQGMDADTYAPALNITRADFVAMLVRTLELKASMTGNFKDVNSGDYYYEALGTAKELKIIEGTGDGIFHPKEKISRQDMFTITARALNTVRNMKMTGSAEALAGFADRAKVAAYAVDSLAGMVKEGLIQGDGQALNPEGNATRAEVAVFMYRILNKIYK